MAELHGLVPLRSGSTSIPDKNTKDLCGKPVFAWPIDEMIKSNIFDRITVSTDSQEYVSAVLARYGIDINIIYRPPRLASNVASLESVMDHYISLEGLNPADDLLTIQVTSPLVRAIDYQKAFDVYKRGCHQSLLTGVRIHRFVWTPNGFPVNYDYNKRPRRQDWDGCFMENGAFYLTSVKAFRESGNRLSGNIGIHEMPAYTLTELDEPHDWDCIKCIARKTSENPSGSL